MTFFTRQRLIGVIVRNIEEMEAIAHDREVADTMLMRLLVSPYPSEVGQRN